MAKVQGHSEDRFASLRALLQAKLDSGEELGASLAVELDGKLVVDLWGGYLDESKNKEWQEDTVVNVWSTTKTISSLAALVVADRGLIDLDEKVCVYWPEFAANGKGDIKVRQIMSHTSGVPAWEKPVTLEEVYDVPTSSARLAQQAPWWTPGTAWGYHILTHGHLISEVIRRTTGKSLKQFITEELAQPLKADFQLGLLPEDYLRVATIVPPPPGPEPSKPAPGSVMEKASGAPVIDASVANTKGWRDAEVGAGNGHGNGRSVAKMLSPIALGGTVNGTKFLSTKTIDQIFQEQAHGVDLVAGVKVRMGTGFGLPTKDTYWDWTPTSGRICGWGGWGGSMAVVDLDRRMTIGYAMNKMHNVGMGSACTKAYVAEIYRILDVEI